jgi:hypothetical protein
VSASPRRNASTLTITEQIDAFLAGNKPATDT